jgi:hypothetical protein
LIQGKASGVRRLFPLLSGFINNPDDDDNPKE